MLVGYMCVSTDTDRQVLDLQRDALIAAGVDERSAVQNSRYLERRFWPENRGLLRDREQRGASLAWRSSDVG
jgi:hypothetical protein